MVLKTLSSMKGFSLFELVVGSGVMALVALGSFTVLDLTFKSRKSVSTETTALDLRNRIYTIARKPAAIAETLSNPTNSSAFTCLNDPAIACDPSTPTPFNLYDVGGTIVNNTFDPNSGYNKTGDPCSNFDKQYGNDGCPLRVELNWTAVCGTNCSTPGTIRMSAKVYHSGRKGNFTVNTNHFDFDVITTLNNSPTGPVADISALWAGTYVTFGNGTLWYWGFTRGGMGGIGPAPIPAIAYSPTQSVLETGGPVTNMTTLMDDGSSHACFVREVGPENQVWCVGNNHRGELGINGIVEKDGVNNNPPPIITPWTEYSFVHTHGINNVGNFNNLKRVSYVDRGVNKERLMLDGGANSFNVAVNENNDILMFGSDQGRFGVSQNFLQTVMMQDDVDVNGDLIVPDIAGCPGAVFSESEYMPYPIIPDEANAVWGSANPAINPGDTPIIDISGGGGHATCVVAGPDAPPPAVPGRVSCWGYNYNGELGDRPILDTAIPFPDGSDNVAHPVLGLPAVLDSVTPWSPDYCYDKTMTNFDVDRQPPSLTHEVLTDIDHDNVPEGPLENIVEIQNYGGLICAIQEVDSTGTVFGRVFCWGEGQYESIGNNRDHGAGDNLFALYPYAQLVRKGNDAPLTNITQVEMGHASVCAIDTSKTVWCWGSNEYGVLGRGISHFALRSSEFAGKVIGLGGLDVEQISVGHHACVLVSNASPQVYCWGSNRYGELGLGNFDNQNHHTPQPVSFPLGP